MKIPSKLFAELLIFYKEEVEKSCIRRARLAGDPVNTIGCKAKKLKKKNPKPQLRKTSCIVKDSIRCGICSELVPRGKYKIHRIEKHGANKCILKTISETSSREKCATPKYTNIFRPWGGGSPGSGKKK